MVMGEATESAPDARIALGPRLASRNVAVERVLRIAGRRESLADLLIGQALRVAGMDLAPIALGAGYDAAKSRSDHPRRLLRTREDAGIDGIDRGELARPGQAVAQPRGLAPAALGQAGAGVVPGREATDLRTRLAVPDDDETGLMCL